MIAACLNFRRSIWPDILDDGEETEEDCFYVGPHRQENSQIDLGPQFVGCGAHRLNLVIIEATRRSKLFQLFLQSVQGTRAVTRARIVITIKSNI